MRVDGEAGVLAREALLDFREAELVAQHVHQIGGVAAVEHAEADVEPDGRGVPANQPIRDRVERAGPGESDGMVVPGSGFRVPRSNPTGTGTWNAEPRMRCVRRVISSAARRVKVRSRMRSGLAPDSTRCATRCASVLVLPVPAPAMMSRGPDPNCAASCCLDSASRMRRVVHGR